jgi:O-Antigen ligase
MDLMPRDSFLALGLLLSTASQLRPGAFPIGLGELFLILWSILMLGRQMLSGDPVLTPALSVLLRFWGAFLFAESLGYIASLVLDVQTDPQWFLHDVLAYPLVALVSCLLGLETDFRIRRIARLLSVFGTLALVVQLAAAAGLFSVPGVDPWYWERLRGWSANPNQLALLCAALSLIAVHLADTAADRSGWIWALICGIIPLVAGRMTGSDTFTLMLLASGLLFLVLKLTVWLRTSATAPQPRVWYALILMIAIPLFASSMLPAAMSMSAEADDLAMGLMKNGGKDAHQEADLRLALWTQAIDLGLQTGMLGMGPGPHLAIPPSLVKARAREANAPGNIQHPENNGAPNFEAHNTILDLFVQGGILADISFLWLLFSAFRHSYRAGLAGLSTMLCCLTLFGMTNLIIRQPLFWFAIVSCLVSSATILPVPAGFLPRPVRNNRIVV